MNNIPKILQDALKPFAPPPPPKPSPTELVIRALVLGLTAPNAKAAQQCADMAEEFAQGLTDDQVEQCKAAAMKGAGLCGMR